jgi:hypothetical protein
MSLSVKLGSRVRSSCSFADSVGAADPTTVVVQFKAPGGTVESWTYGASNMVRDAAASYHYDLTPDAVGAWHVKWIAAGTVVAIDEATFQVTATSF